MDLLGRCGESCILTLLRARFAWEVLGMVPSEVPRARFRVTGAGIRARGVRFTWQAWGMVRPAAWPGIVLRGRRRDSRTAGETAIGFVALCEKSRACVCVCEWMSAAVRNRGRRRESADLWMLAWSGRFAERSGSLTQLARCTALCNARRSGGLRTGTSLERA